MATQLERDEVKHLSANTFDALPVVLEPAEILPAPEAKDHNT